MFIKKKNKSLMQSNTVLSDLLKIVDIKNEIVVLKKSYVMLLEILPINFSLKSDSEQSYIIDCYKELLKILNTDFQITTISRKADLSEHLNYMEKHFNNEQDENIREQIAYYMEFVKESSKKTAVSRRFIVAIPFDLPTGMKFEDVDFDSVSNFLYDIKGKITSGLRKCGNIVKEPDNPTQFTAEILYTLLNRKTSESQSLPTNIGKLFV